jgi:hypothetical protein
MNEENNQEEQASTATAKPASSKPSARKAALLTAAGTLPLLLSMMAGTASKPARNAPVSTASHRTAMDVSDLEFQPGCRMPFAGDPVEGIDNVCSIEGSGTDQKKQAESRAKNNFCADTSSPTPITYQTFIDLQARPKIKVGPDRSVLEKILTENGVTLGEGSYVEFVGFLLNAQYSNRSKGEAVNCMIPGVDTNDIHIELVNVDTPDEDDPCLSVTAQISPHFRPESWTPQKLNGLKAHLMRFRGPLFYDGGGSHAPCHDDKRPSPARASVWEIHPVYSVDICRQKGGKTCKSWIPLEQWDKADSTEDDEG